MKTNIYIYIYVILLLIHYCILMFHIYTYRWLAGHTFESSVMENEFKALAAKHNQNNTLPPSSSSSDKNSKNTLHKASEAAAKASQGKVIPAHNDAIHKIANDEKKPQKKSSMDRPGLAPKAVRPVGPGELPTVAALLAAVPPSVVLMYVCASVGVTAGLAVLLYVAYLKPKLLETKKQK